MVPRMRVRQLLPPSPRFIGAALAAAMVLGSGVAAATAASPASPKTHYTSTSKPGWYKRKAVCKRVKLSSPTNPSGTVGEAGGGYNAYWLDVVVAKGVGCTTARKLAKKAWIDGTSGGLKWRLRNSWKPKGSGSAWVGDFLGTGGGKRIEYHAVH